MGKIDRIVPVILCGGSGTRLWPLSRENLPKQFLSLAGSSESLFQQTFTRLDGISNLDTAVVVTNENHRFIALDQLHEIHQSAHIILEPVGKNTAASLTLAALAVAELKIQTDTPSPDDAILVVLPADHVIANKEAFEKAIRHATEVVKHHDGVIVTLGIEPTRAETGYGYIEFVNSVGVYQNYLVSRFVEKPNRMQAEQYLEQGNYAWNAGIFVVKASVWLRAVQTFSPNIYQFTQQSWQKRQFDNPFIRPCADSFHQVPSDSIDYAVMEHCPNDQFKIQMVKLVADWNDLGSWQAVSEQNAIDENHNTLLGDVLVIDSHHCMVNSNRLVALLGVSNLVVVETPDAILIADKDKSQEVKAIVQKLQADKRVECVSHRKVYRPWGWYDSIDESERFKVKRICVKPKASLSMQKHYHRAEHWVVVKGTAEVTCGDKILLLTENQSAYIPLGEVHRLRNPGTIPLEIIEVQSGSYLEEDDIVRFDDVYGRG